MGIARVLLATSTLLMVWFEPTAPAVYAPLVRALLAAYAGFAGFVLLLTRTHADAAFRLRVLVFCCDLSFGVILTLMTRGPASPFFPFLMFSVVSAAYRWSSRETLITTVIVIGALGVEALLVGTSTPLSIGLWEGDFVASDPIIRVMYLVIAGLLLAALADQEKQRRDEASTIASIMEQAGSAAGPDGTLEAPLGFVLRAFHANRALLLLTQVSTDRVFLWEAALDEGARAARVTSLELDDEQQGTYLFEVPGPSWHALRFRASDWFDLLAIDARGNLLPTAPFTLPAAFLVAYPCQGVLGVSITVGMEWAGRVLLIDPHITGNREAALRLAHRLARQIGPAAHQGYLLGTLRADAATAERARLARELHDGVMQSLLAAEVEVEVVRRRWAKDAPQLDEALTHVRTVLRAETKNLRVLTQRLNTSDAGSRPLPDLRDMVARFERDTGIQTRFVSDAGSAPMSQRSRHEISRILQEALVNVRKHSGARHVVVRAGAADGRLQLSIEDDGCGFPFSGRLSAPELQAARQGPAVIVERVRELGGAISVESIPGHGSRIEVVVPLQR